MPMTEDTAAFLDTAEHAVTALLGTTEITGILDAGFDDASVSGFGPAGSSPTLFTPAISATARPEGLTLAITSGPCSGTSYKVASAHPDGTGWVSLHLIS